MTEYEVCMVVLALCVAFIGLTIFLYIKTGYGGNWEWFFSKSFRQQIRKEKAQMSWARYISSDSVKQLDENGNDAWEG